MGWLALRTAAKGRGCERHLCEESQCSDTSGEPIMGFLMEQSIEAHRSEQGKLANHALCRDVGKIEVG